MKQAFLAIGLTAFMVGELSFTTSGQIITGSAKYSNVTTFSANYGATSYAAASVVCMGLMDDGTTNRKIAISFNKQDWSVIHSVGRTDYLTPTEIGYYVNTLNSNTAPAFHLIDWETVGSALF